MIDIKLKGEPRVIEIGKDKVLDLGKIKFYPTEEDTNEFVSFETESGKVCDFACTSWGFYLGPSLNSRLVSEGFKTALMVNKKSQLYVVAVEKEKLNVFNEYIERQGTRVIHWLDEGWTTKN